MMPVRCYTCNDVIAHKSEAYDKLIHSGKKGKEVFDALGIDRMCCRRMFLGYVNLYDDLIKYPNKDVVLDEGGTVLKREAEQTRRISCD